MSCSALTNIWGYFRADLGDIHWLIRRMWTGCLVGQKSETLFSPQKMDLTYNYHCFQWKLETIQMAFSLRTSKQVLARLLHYLHFKHVSWIQHSALCGCTSHMLGYFTKLTTPPISISWTFQPGILNLSPHPKETNSKMVDFNDLCWTWQLYPQVLKLQNARVQRPVTFGFLEAW